MNTKHYHLEFFEQGDLYDAVVEKRRFVTIDNNIGSFVGIIGNGVIEGWNLTILPDGVTARVSPGFGIINGNFSESPYTVKLKSELLIGELPVPFYEENEYDFLLFSEYEHYVNCIRVYRDYNPLVLANDFDDLYEGSGIIPPVDYIHFDDFLDYIQSVRNIPGYENYDIEIDIKNEKVKALKYLDIDLSVYQNNDVQLLVQRKSNSSIGSYNDLSSLIENLGCRPHFEDFDSYRVYEEVLKSYLEQKADPVVGTDYYRWYESEDNRVTEISVVPVLSDQVVSSSLQIGRIIIRNSNVVSFNEDEKINIKNLKDKLEKYTYSALNKHKHNKNGINPDKINLNLLTRKCFLINEGARYRYAISGLEKISDHNTHTHYYWVNKEGNGVTLGTVGNIEPHFHFIENFEIEHSHHSQRHKNITYDQFAENMELYLNGNSISSLFLLNQNDSIIRIPKEFHIPRINYFAIDYDSGFSFSGDYISFYHFFKDMFNEYYQINKAILKELEIEENFVLNEDYLIKLSLGIDSCFLNKDSYRLKSVLFDFETEKTNQEGETETSIDTKDIKVFSDSFHIVLNSNIGIQPYLELDYIDNVEIQGTLPASNIISIDAQKFTEGKIDLKIIPMISHLGRLNELFLSSDFRGITQDYISYNFVARYTDYSFGHRHELFINENGNGVTDISIGSGARHYHEIVNNEIVNTFYEGDTFSEHSHILENFIPSFSKYLYGIIEDENGNLIATGSDGLTIIPQSHCVKVYLPISDIEEFASEVFSLFSWKNRFYLVKTVYFQDSNDLFNQIRNLLLDYRTEFPNERRYLFFNIQRVLEREYRFRDVHDYIFEAPGKNAIRFQFKKHFIEDSIPPEMFMNIDLVKPRSFGCFEDSVNDDIYLVFNGVNSCYLQNINGNFINGLEYYPLSNDTYQRYTKFIITQVGEGWGFYQGNVFYKSPTIESQITIYPFPYTDVIYDISEVGNGDILLLGSHNVYFKIFGQQNYFNIIYSFESLNQKVKIDFNNLSTTVENGHTHEVTINTIKNGITSEEDSHFHLIQNNVLLEENGHSHELIFPLYLESGSKIYKSTDKGENWSFYCDLSSYDYFTWEIYNENIILESKGNLYSINNNDHLYLGQIGTIYGIGFSFDYSSLYLGEKDKIKIYNEDSFESNNFPIAYDFPETNSFILHDEEQNLITEKFLVDSLNSKAYFSESVGKNIYLKNEYNEKYLKNGGWTDSNYDMYYDGLLAEENKVKQDLNVLYNLNASKGIINLLNSYRVEGTTNSIVTGGGMTITTDTPYVRNVDELLEQIEEYKTYDSENIPDKFFDKTVWVTLAKSDAIHYFPPPIDIILTGNQEYAVLSINEIAQAYGPLENFQNGYYKLVSPMALGTLRPSRSVQNTSTSYLVLDKDFVSPLFSSVILYDGVDFVYSRVTSVFENKISFENNFIDPFRPSHVFVVGDSEQFKINIYKSKIINNGKYSHKDIDDFISEKNNLNQNNKANIFYKNLISFKNNYAENVGFKNFINYDLNYSQNPLNSDYYGNYIDILKTDFNSQVLLDAGVFDRDHLIDIIIGTGFFENKIFVVSSSAIFVYSSNLNSFIVWFDSRVGIINQVIIYGNELAVISSTGIWFVNNNGEFLISDYFLEGLGYEYGFLRYQDSSSFIESPLKPYNVTYDELEDITKITGVANDFDGFRAGLALVISTVSENFSFIILDVGEDFEYISVEGYFDEGSVSLVAKLNPLWNFNQDGTNTLTQRANPLLVFGNGKIDFFDGFWSNVQFSPQRSGKVLDNSIYRAGLSVIVYGNKNYSEIYSSSNVGRSYSRDYSDLEKDYIVSSVEIENNYFKIELKNAFFEPAFLIGRSVKINDVDYIVCYNDAQNLYIEQLNNLNFNHVTLLGNNLSSIIAHQDSFYVTNGNSLYSDFGGFYKRYKVGFSFYKNFKKVMSVDFKTQTIRTESGVVFVAVPMNYNVNIFGFVTSGDQTARILNVELTEESLGNNRIYKISHDLEFLSGELIFKYSLNNTVLFFKENVPRRISSVFYANLMSYTKVGIHQIKENYIVLDAVLRSTVSFVYLFSDSEDFEARFMFTENSFNKDFGENDLSGLKIYSEWESSNSISTSTRVIKSNSLDLIKFEVSEADLPHFLSNRAEHYIEFRKFFKYDSLYSETSLNNFHYHTVELINKAFNLNVLNIISNNNIYEFEIDDSVWAGDSVLHSSNVAEGALFHFYANNTSQVHSLYILNYGVNYIRAFSLNDISDVEGVINIDLTRYGHTVSTVYKGLIVDTGVISVDVNSSDNTIPITGNIQLGDELVVFNSKGINLKFKIEDVSLNNITLDKSIGRDLDIQDINRYNILRNTGPVHEHVIKNGWIMPTNSNYSDLFATPEHIHYITHSYGENLKIVDNKDSFYIFGNKRVSVQDFEYNTNIILNKEDNDNQASDDVGNFVSFDSQNDNLYVLTDKNKILYKNL